MDKLRGHKTIGILLLLLIAAPALAEEMQGRVYWYADGDSFKFKGRHIKDECRMLGYNAPERNEKGPPSGAAAKKKLMSLIDGRDLRISAEKRDKYNRLLCQVWLSDGTHVNQVMRRWLEAQGYKGVGKYDWMKGQRSSNPRKQNKVNRYPRKSRLINPGTFDKCKSTADCKIGYHCAKGGERSSNRSGVCVKRY